jgi:uncharacterized membrane protein
LLYLSLKFLHLIGLVLGVGTGFAMARLGASTRDMKPEERVSFMLRAAAIGKNGSWGLVLLLLTGIAMLLVRGVHEVFAFAGGAFHLKLTLVVVLIGVYGYMQVVLKKAREAGGGPAMAKLPKLSAVVLLLGIGIVAAAVAAFK